MPQFLADESCGMPVVGALREAGHDVVAIADDSPGVSDDRVIEKAVREQRILITRTLILVNWFTRTHMSPVE